MKIKIFDYTLCLFLFLSPLFLFRDYQASLSRSLFFVTGSLILFILSLSMEPKRVLKDFWLMVFLLLALARVFVNEQLGPGEWFNFWYSMAGFFYILCGTLLFRTVYCYADGVKKYFKPILALCILNCILAISQQLGYDFFWGNLVRYNPICGFFSTPQQLTQYSAISIPILFFINPALVTIPLISMVLAKEISAIVALFAGVLFGLFYLNKKRMCVLLLGISFILLFTNIDRVKVKWYTRPVVWEKTVKAIFKKPYLGWGYQSFTSVVIENEDKIGKVQNPNAFNDYLHTAQELGLPILVILFMFFKNYFVRFHKIYGKSLLLICLASSICIGLVNMSGQGLIRYAGVSGTFIVLFALFCIQLEKENQDGRHSS